MDYRKKGFSLIELLVTIAVIAAITTIIVPSISGTTNAAKYQKAVATAEAINMAQVSYRLSHGLSGWDALTQEARYTAVSEYLQYPEASLAALNTKLGHTIQFQDLAGDKFQKVTINGNPDY